MELAGDGILLRPWREEDAPVVHAACQDPEILHWIPVIPRPYTEDDARAFVSGQLPLGDQLAVTEGGRVVGSIGVGVNEQKTGHLG